MNNIRAARLAKGLSQKVVAMDLGVSIPTVSDWESGKKSPTVKNLLALSRLFDKTSDYLLGYAESSQGSEAYTEQDISEENLKFALFGEVGEISDAVWAEVQGFAKLAFKHEAMKREREGRSYDDANAV